MSDVRWKRSNTSAFCHLASAIILAVHRNQKFLIALRVLHSLLNEFHSFERSHVGKMFTKDPQALKRFFVNQQVISSCAGCCDIDRRVNALVGKFPVQLYFTVSRSFELFKNYIV